MTRPGATQARSIASFEQRYPVLFDEVYRALALTLGDPALAEDATQEALVKAYRRWDEVGGYANPAGWVYRVGLNWARSRLRRLAREVLSVWPVERSGGPLPTPSDPAVAGALRALPAGQRAVVVLRLQLDWSVQAVAEALEISPGTVKSRLARALERLRDHLEGS